MAALTCAQCGSAAIVGPRFAQDGLGAWLRYRCFDCGHTWREAATDDRRDLRFGAGSRFTRATLYWLALGLAALGDGAGVGLHAEIITATSIAVVSIISAIGSWFGRSARGTAAEVQRALRGIRDALAGVAGQLVNFVRDTGRLLALVARALGRFWREILRPLFVKLDEWIRRAFRWLRETFGPILEFLRDVRRRILELYTKWLRPIFDTIDAIRRVLGILGRFGVQWARELDAKLAELEDRLLEPIRFALRKLNEVIDVIDRVITADGLLQRYTLFRTAVRDLGAIAAIWHNVKSRPLTEADRAAALARDDNATPAQIASAFREWVTTGGGPDAPVIEELSADFRAALRRA